MFTQNVTANAA